MGSNWRGMWRSHEVIFKDMDIIANTYVGKKIQQKMKNKMKEREGAFGGSIPCILFQVTCPGLYLSLLHGMSHPFIHLCFITHVMEPLPGARSSGMDAVNSEICFSYLCP